MQMHDLCPLLACVIPVYNISFYFSLIPLVVSPGYTIVLLNQLYCVLKLFVC